MKLSLLHQDECLQNSNIKKINFVSAQSIKSLAEQLRSWKCLAKLFLLSKSILIKCLTFYKIALKGTQIPSSKTLLSSKELQQAWEASL